VGTEWAAEPEGVDAEGAAEPVEVDAGGAAEPVGVDAEWAAGSVGVDAKGAAEPVGVDAGRYDEAVGVEEGVAGVLIARAVDGTVSCGGRRAELTATRRARMSAADSGAGTVERAREIASERIEGEVDLLEGEE
jgi:hypothetical protein